MTANIPSKPQVSDLKSNNGIKNSKSAITGDKPQSEQILEIMLNDDIATSEARAQRSVEEDARWWVNMITRTAIENSAGAAAASMAAIIPNMVMNTSFGFANGLQNGFQGGANSFQNNQWSNQNNTFGATDPNQMFT